MRKYKRRGRFPFVELTRNRGIRLTVGILQRHILKIALYLIQPEPMRQRGIQIISLVGYGLDRLLIGMMVDKPHQYEAIDNHDDYHTDILGKNQQQAAEILTIGSRTATVECGNLKQATHHLAISAPQTSSTPSGVIYSD